MQQCYGGADATCEAIGALAYDCICDSDDCTVNNPISFCCPSRGMKKKCIACALKLKSCVVKFFYVYTEFFAQEMLKFQFCCWIIESPGQVLLKFSAFACIQPPNEGYTPPGGGTTLNHWYHDPITGECRELKYQGYGGNANNFQTKDHCESYCKQSKLIIKQLNVS